MGDQSHAVSFFCGGSRNFDCFIHLFDEVFVLEVDLKTLNKRLSSRPENEWGGQENERKFIAQLHATKEDIPKSAVIIDATASVSNIVNIILEKST
ncbi:MAG: hypothetical protein COB02_10785 [Candidatus Cloacimonadota bacterium]|nr:MAG: hypothetical protein COB02_10785 [Candidatus Cloacimonadota bacterium]